MTCLADNTGCLSMSSTELKNCVSVKHRKASITNKKMTRQTAKYTFRS